MALLKITRHKQTEPLGLPLVENTILLCEREAFVALLEEGKNQEDCVCYQK